MNQPLGLFEGYGIELEYMIVDSNHLGVRPISDQVMLEVAGSIVSDVEDGDITWSNELVLHVIELKTTSPVSSLEQLETSFQRSLGRINQILESKNAKLMPSAMHPFMNPYTDTCLWPHDNNEVYSSYDRIFDCRGHGWSNLQSMHINLPFRDDAEFTKLHTAIRFLLPLLPALTASSPLVEGKLTGSKDNRLLFYQQNQKRVPSIAGQVIPEFVSSIDDYHQKVLAPIFQDIAVHDPEEILREDWLNSRGAIARFGRQTIEIRVLDTQESPVVDLAIADLIASVLKCLVEEKWISFEDQSTVTTPELKSIFDQTTRDAETASIDQASYLNAWKRSEPCSAQELWRWMFEKVQSDGSLSQTHASVISKLLNSGSLASRLTLAIGPQPSHERIHSVYLELCNNLQKGTLFRM